MPGTRPDKKELAHMKALQEMGVTPTAIARRMGRSHHTVIKYLESDVYNNPDIRNLVDRIKVKEIDDLYLIGAKARHRLHELLDEGDTKAIETTAIMDRAFQQRRLLEGQATEIVDHAGITKEMAELKARRALLEEKLRLLEEQESQVIDITPQVEDENAGN